MLRFLAVLLAATFGFAPTLAVRADIAYFVSNTTGGLYALNTAGGTITPLTEADAFPGATALAMGPDGNLYVGDATGGGSIRRYTMAGGGVSTVVTLNAVSPTSIAFTPGASMLVGRNPESEFSGYPSGPVLEVVGWNSDSPGVQNFTSGTALDYQTGLAVAADGTVFVSNTTYDVLATPPALVGNVLKFTGSGAYQSVVAANATAGLEGPAGLGVFGTSLYVASTMNGKVYKTDLSNPNTATNTIEFATTASGYIGPLAMLSDGGLLVGSVSGTDGSIYQFDAAGTLVATFGGASYGQIGGIVAVPEPTTVTLAGVAVLGGTLWRLRRRRWA